MTDRLAQLADGGVAVSAGALELERLALAAGGVGDWSAYQAGEHLLFVISGSGVAKVNGEDLALAERSVLCLEPGERAALSAGENGLEALVARAGF